MAQIVKQSATSYTLTVSTADATLLDIQLTIYGSGLLDSWLRDRQQVQDDADITAAKDGKADVTTKTRLRAKLGL